MAPGHSPSLSTSIPMEVKAGFILEEASLLLLILSSSLSCNSHPPSPPPCQSPSPPPSPPPSPSPSSPTYPPPSHPPPPSPPPSPPPFPPLFLLPPLLPLLLPLTPSLLPTNPAKQLVAGDLFPSLLSTEHNIQTISCFVCKLNYHI